MIGYDDLAYRCDERTLFRQVIPAPTLVTAVKGR